MTYTIRKSQNYSVSQWSGGATTELFIYPEEGNYAKRQFDVRISSATIEVEKSNFTPLEGYQRLLMVLEGEVTLIHRLSQGERIVKLVPFEQDYFLGDNETYSIGQCRDFNIIYKSSYDAELYAANTSKTIIEMPNHYLIVSLKSVQIHLSWSKDVITLDPMDSLEIYNETGFIEVEPLESSDVSALICRFRQK